MARSPFGWSLPPGCTQRQIDEAFGDEGVTKLQDDIFELLERADIAERFIDGIMELIRQGELDRCNRDDAAMIDQLAEAERDRRMWEDAEAHNRWEDTNK
jgi:hypothetical protein